MKFKHLSEHPPSLTLRLSLLFGISAFVVFFLFGWMIEESINRHFTAEDTSELEVVAKAIESAVFTDMPENSLASLERRFDDILVGHHGASLLIRDSNSQPIYSSAGPDLSKFTAVSTGMSGEGSIDFLNDGHHTFRVLTKSLRYPISSQGETYTIAVAVPIDHHLRFIDGFRNTLWIMIAGSIIITSLMGWFAVQQGHAPLRKMVAQIRRISTNELNTRLSPDRVPRELKDLASSFNEMLEHMEEAFIRLSNFSADIAHELRTPVTNLMTQTQVALSQTRNQEEYREILYSNVEEYEHMSQMIRDMLFLAQADNGLNKPNNTEIELAGEVRALFDYYEALIEEHDIRVEVLGNAKIVGDQLMIRRALNNLLANAIRHTPAGGTVSIHIDCPTNGDIHVDVINPSADIAPAHLLKIFDRFYRVDASRQESGTGLGMAITKSIIDAHNGKIEVTSTGGVTCFRISLPNTLGTPSGDNRP